MHDTTRALVHTFLHAGAPHPKRELDRGPSFRTAPHTDRQQSYLVDIPLHGYSYTNLEMNTIEAK